MNKTLTCFQKDDYKICITEATTSDILSIIVSARHTSSMDILTATRVYCLYPDLLDAGENILMVPNHYPCHIGGGESFASFNDGGGR